MRCPECYSPDDRATPLRNETECLENHTQYICSTCGRAVCVYKDEKGQHGWMSSFGSFNEAMLYLRAAEVSNRGVCGIYELTDGVKVFYKIFPSQDDLFRYLMKSPGKVCPLGEALFVSENYRPFDEDQLKKLSKEEAEKYLEEKERADE